MNILKLPDSFLGTMSNMKIIYIESTIVLPDIDLAGNFMVHS